MKNIKIIIACIAIIATYLSVNAFISNPHGATAPSVPVLSSPSSGATGVSLTPALSWGNSTGGTGTREYDVMLTLSSDVNFSSPIVNVSNISEGVDKSTYTIPASTLSNNTVYIWKVRSHASGEFSSFSGTRQFTTIP